MTDLMLQNLQLGHIFDTPHYGVNIADINWWAILIMARRWRFKRPNHRADKDLGQVITERIKR